MTTKTFVCKISVTPAGVPANRSPLPIPDVVHTAGFTGYLSPNPLSRTLFDLI